MRGIGFHNLPDSTWVAVLRLLPPLERRVVVPLVCKRFAALAAASTDLWQQVQLSIPADFRQSVSMPDLYAWFVRREGLVRSLHVSIGTDDAWAPLLALLGVAGRGLEHLRVAGDGQSCAVAGCTAPWLALTPNLRSLELDDVCDHSIGEARWPPGAPPPPHPPLHACSAAWMRSSPGFAAMAASTNGSRQQPAPQCMRRLFAGRSLCSASAPRAAHALAACSWAAGLTRLELSYCGEEGLYSIPTHVGCAPAPVQTWRRNLAPRHAAGLPLHRRASAAGWPCACHSRTSAPHRL